MASMPHYMSQGVNKMTAHGIDKAVHGLVEVVNLSLTGVEEIIVFVIGMMTNTYLCLITLAVSGSLHYAVDLLNNVQGELNNTLKAIGSDISKATSDVQSSLNTLAKGINTFLGSSVPSIDMSKEVNALNNFKLPTNFNDDLIKLNNSIPTFDQVKNVTDTLIRLPFEDLKKLIGVQMGNYSFNDSLFPVPQKKQLTFCSDNNDINTFFDELVKIERIAQKVFIAVLTIAAVVACVPMAWLEIRKWRSLQQRARLVGMKAYDPMDAVYMSSRPWTSRIGWWFAGKFNSPRRQIIARWAVAYPTSIPALFILSIALAGLFSCLCQYIFLKMIEKEVPELTAMVANFTDKVVDELNNASARWATDSNQVIATEGLKLNQNLLGWVNTSTVAVNNTLNAFVDETIHLLNVSFGGTPLYDPVVGVFNCLIELKIRGIESGLTWVHDNAHIAFPQLPNDTFTLAGLAKSTDNNDASNFLSDPGTVAADDINSAVNHVTNFIAEAIRQEAIISTMVLVAWLILVLISIIRAFLLFGGRDKVRGEAGNEYNTPAPEPQMPVMQEAMPPPVMTQHRPQSAAPPYQYADPDVNRSAPYALNPHPFPRAAENNEKEAGEGWPFQRNLTQRASPHVDHKGDFLDEKDGGFI